jgi:hypothetical protein
MPQACQKCVSCDIPYIRDERTKILTLIGYGNDLRLASNYCGHFEGHVMLAVTLYRPMTNAYMMLCHPIHEWIENYLPEIIVVGFSTA